MGDSTTDPGHLRPRNRRRNHSSCHPETSQPYPKSTPNVSSSIHALDLRLPSNVHIPSALASLRIHVLQYLSDLEARLALLDFRATNIPMSPTRLHASPHSSANQDSSPSSPDRDEADGVEDLDISVQDVTDFVKKGFAILRDIRSDVCSYLPDDLGFPSAHGSSLRERFPDLDVRSKLAKLGELEIPNMPAMPSMEEIKLRLKEMSPSTIDPLSYVPRLNDHLQRLQKHFQEFPPFGPFARTFPRLSISPPKVLSDLMTELLEEDTEETIQKHMMLAQQAELTMHEEVRIGLSKSMNGSRLIGYQDLPDRWRNNDFVLAGYRFIPFSRWRNLLFSVLQFHNETLNIHTHLLPLLTLVSPIIPYVIPSSFNVFTPVRSFLAYYSCIPMLLPSDPTLDFLPVSFFTFSTVFCLLSSVIWHLCSGSSDIEVVDSAALLDYVGIGWLISSSVQSGIYYGFHCRPTLLKFYTGLCIVTGLAGTIVPFQQWFNERRYKKYRVLFFLGLAFASLLPLTHLAISMGPIATLREVAPLTPSWACYFIGLFFYVTHFPECSFPGWFDWGNSHTMWHIFIILAIRLHYVGLGQLKAGVAAAGMLCNV